MMQKKVIFKDSEIVEFCQATKDTNEIHNPEFMRKMGKRAIVPGMLAFTNTVNLSSEFLKTRADSIKVLFNSLLSSGDFVTLTASTDPANPLEVRLSAFNHKDTLTTKDDYTRIYKSGHLFDFGFTGKLRRLPIENAQFESFNKLTCANDSLVSGFMFAVAYASRALFDSIDHPETEIEIEVDNLINRNSKISPFYQSLDIFIPSPFPELETNGFLDYRIHIEREKICKLYIAYVRCEQDGRVIYNSIYKLVGISDGIILRMAKPAKFRKDQ